LCGQRAGKKSAVDLLAPVRTIDRAQQRSSWLGLPLAVIKKYGDDQGGNLVGLIAYRGFLSLFPLLLLFISVLGFVLHGDPSVRKTIEGSVLKQFPVIGSQIGSLRGSGIGLAVGLLGALWAGLGIVLALQSTMDSVWAVPHKQRADFVSSRIRALKLLAALGILSVVSTAVSALVAGGLGGAGTRVAGIAISLLLNVIVFATAFRLLTDPDVATRDLWPGVVIAAVAWELLQVLGGIYFNHVVRGASETYGTFATVIGLLAWLHLGATFTVLAAETNVVRTRRLWPRSLFGVERPEDEQALRDLAKIEERDRRETVDVSFETKQRS
jgi:YihY family inner membrane protein